VRRILAMIVAAAVAAGMVAGPVAAARPAVKVAVVVGPVGSLTDMYRSIGTAAAREARRWTDDVVTVFSPDATWPRVRAALRGASIVVYLGHGNGWPSPYRDALYPPTQNGLGLNPVAGGDDSAHQYFGEAFLAREAHLAQGAVVLLHHLCYASGNSEPGLAEGSLDVGRQRVDNYAAGWIRAGAQAVVADTYGDPAGYIRAVLGSKASIEQVWRAAPTFHDHVIAFTSQRSPGYRALMDPTSPASGFYRSLVVQPGLATGEVRAGASGVRSGGGLVGGTGVASLAAQGVTFQAPGLAVSASTRQGFVVGTKATLSLPLKIPRGVTIPSGVQLGIRWDPIRVDLAGASASTSASPAPSTGPSPTADPSASGSPDPGLSADPSASVVPSASPDPDSAPTPSPAPTTTPIPAAGAAPPIDLVAPEVVSTVVTSVPATIRGGRLVVTVDLPAAAGAYRLVTTVHAPGGVAYDAATQALVPALAVRVSRPLSVAYGVVPTIEVETGGSIRLPVRVANDGSEPWADRPILGEDLVDPSVVTIHPTARLVARWLPLGIGAAVAPETPTVSASARVDPGAQTTVELALIAPTVPGDYLLLLDIDSPLHGSLAAAGVPPAQVRVTVGSAPTPAPRPVPAPSALP
jgi:hypothetical protein